MFSRFDCFSPSRNYVPENRENDYLKLFRIQIYQK